MYEYKPSLKKTETFDMVVLLSTDNYLKTRNTVIKCGHDTCILVQLQAILCQ